MRLSAVVVVVIVIVIVLALATSARAQDAFEIQVYASDTAARGEPGVEVHANYHVIRDALDEAHLTLEPHYGLTEWIELGGYLQSAMTSDGDPAFAGAKLRVKVRYPERLWRERIGLAVNTELSAVPEQFEPDVWGSEVRPIADLMTEYVYASINPILAIDLAGELAGRPQLEPAAKLALRVPHVAVGVEAYGAFGPLDDLGSETVGTLLGCVDVAGSWFDLNVGAGPSWGGSDRVIVKLIFGVHP